MFLFWGMLGACMQLDITCVSKLPLKPSAERIKEQRCQVPTSYCVGPLCTRSVMLPCRFNSSEAATRSAFGGQREVHIGRYRLSCSRDCFLMPLHLMNNCSKNALQEHRVTAWSPGKAAYSASFFCQATSSCKAHSLESGANSDVE